MMTFLLALALLQQNDPPAKEPATKEALERFSKAYKAAKEPSDRAAAVTDLARTLDDKVIAKLGALLGVDDPTVRIAAAKGLSAAASAEQKKKAINVLSRAFPANAGDPLVVVALVDSMETMQDGLGYAVLKANLRSPDPQTSKAAIEAAGQIRDKSFVAPLIDHARLLEAASRETTNVGPNGRTVTGGGMIPGGGAVGDPDAPKRARLLVPLIHKALEAITKQNFKSMTEWAEWWKKNEADFKPAK
jgi:HEAT repeat protein